MIVLDSTMLLLMLRPNVRAPIDPETKLPVTDAEARLSYFIQGLEKAKTKIIVPTPALSEILVNAGNGTQQLIEIIQKSALFSIEPFDTLAAIEVAAMTKSAKDSGGKKGESSASWAKVKYDRQIVAIAKVNRATAIYSDDNDIHKHAAGLNLPAYRFADLPLPPEDAQGSLQLESESEAEGESRVDTDVISGDKGDE